MFLCMYMYILLKLFKLNFYIIKYVKKISSFDNDLEGILNSLDKKKGGGGRGGFNLR